jgi:hypothetical protein
MFCREDNLSESITFEEGKFINKTENNYLYYF